MNKYNRVVSEPFVVLYFGSFDRYFSLRFFVIIIPTQRFIGLKTYNTIEYIARMNSHNIIFIVNDFFSQLITFYKTNFELCYTYSRTYI